jgi:hypothetical protein
MTGFGVAFVDNTETGLFQFVTAFRTLPEVFPNEESAKRRVEDVEDLDRAEKADRYFVL